jgi:hypothetical protein
MAGLKYMTKNRRMSIFRALKQGTFCICSLPCRITKDFETTNYNTHLLLQLIKTRLLVSTIQSFIGAPPELKTFLKVAFTVYTWRTIFFRLMQKTSSLTPQN